MGKSRDELTRAIPVLNQNPRAKEMMAAMPKTVKFDLKGEDKPFFVVVEGGALSLKDTAGKPDIIVSGDSTEVAKVVSRQREITHPIAEGKIWVSAGKLSQMIVFDRVLAFQKRQ